MTADLTFAPIGLDELIERAALLTRLDRKYLIPSGDLPALLTGLPADVRVLDVDGRRSFRYLSTYFDTAGLDSYLTTARQRRRRFKVRVRSYVDTGAQFLEIKTRGPRGTTIKQRFPYAGSSATLDPEAHTLAVQALAAAGVPADGLRFHPTLTTEYERTTLFVASTGSRVTIDRRLAWSLPDGTTTGTPGRVIVETKSERSTSPVDQLLWSMSHRPCAISKYATGLAALHPDLPANRWHRILRAFQPQTQPTPASARALERQP
ncbi:VTC domain-containing protein [Winogradskya consettensis]|uniref:VTC domain-containing protein n=1 Tax=Winogradskya consettensis TaxID=113560 RepID=A0A919SV28_9ACTN|nr:polyphosphate polymerase domain-containing protein [Actinoplanes consettensis]GIM77588.1 VTC domain-containing protein [Actinoplanes consettensis]